MKTTLKQLQIFASIARNGSISKAAEENFLSQSAVSMSLAEMEKQLEEKLFDRIGRRLVLNHLGRTVLPKVQDVLERVNEIEHLCARQTAEVTGSLHIGGSSTIGNYLIPAVIGDFVKKFPETKLFLDVGNTEYIKQELLRFNIDIGFIEGYCDHPNIIATPWVPDRLTVFCAPDHPLSRVAAPEVEDLYRADWILREKGSGTREVFKRALQGQANRLNLFLELGHTEAIKQAVGAGLGISCLSIQAIKRDLEEGKLVEIPTPFWDLNRMFSFVVHKEKHQTRVFREFIDYCQSDRRLLFCPLFQDR